MESIWLTVKSSLQNRVPAHSFRMWLEPVHYVSGADDCLVLGCPNFFSKKRVKCMFGNLIADGVTEQVGKRMRVEYEVDRCKPVAEACSESRTALQTVANTPAKPKITLPQQMSLPTATATLNTSGRMLRRDYTFDTFVVGKHNAFPYSAALSLAAGNHTYDNSLYLFSDTGLGKSHLTQAIGHYITEAAPGKRVYYVTAEDFTNEMIHAVRNQKMDTFKEKYRTRCDVLLLDDVHFFSGKEKTQSELSMTLDYLMEAERTIIFSGMYPPSEIPKLSEQLRSRFTTGIVSEMNAPAFRSRVKILQSVATERNMRVPMPVMEYLASELTGNIRILKSGLMGVASRSSLLGCPIDLPLAESVIAKLAGERKAITIDVIKKMVAASYGISVADMISKSRRKTIVQPRQMAIYLSRTYTDQPLQVISRSFNRYHATAMHAIKVVEKGVRENPAMKAQVGILSKKLENGDF